MGSSNDRREEVPRSKWGKMKEYLVRNRGKKSLDFKRTFPAARSTYYFLNREE